MPSYAEKLRDPRWQKFRVEVFRAAEFMCQDCGKGSNLHAHHLQYRAGAEPWEYELYEMRSLCGECHRAWHVRLDSMRYKWDRLWPYAQEELLDLAISLLRDSETIYQYPHYGPRRARQ